MHRNQTGTVLFPDVAELAQSSGIIVHACRWHDAQRMELGRIFELGRAVGVFQFGKARDNTATITEHTDRTALPVPFAGLIGGFELTKQVNHNILVLGQTFQAGYKAWPFALFELIQIRCVMQLFRHNIFLSSRVALFCPAKGWNSGIVRVLAQTADPVS